MADSLEQVLARIKQFGQSHGLDFESEILAYDVKRRGIISTVSLHRWIGTMGISLSNRNVQTLAVGYSKDGGVDAFKLIEDLRQSQTFTQTVSSRPTNCTSELEELSRDLSARRQTLREVLAPYDRRNAGRVTPANFYRAFGATPTARTIASAYAIDDEVDYARLGNDVRSIHRTLKFATTEIPAPTPGFAAFATSVKTRGVDARSILAQKDPLNTGKIPTVQFQSILSFIDSKLTPDIVQEIAKPFQVDSRDVNYFLFLEAIDQFVPAPPTRPSPSSEDIAKLTQIQNPNYLLQQAKEIIEERRIDVDLHFSCLAREGLGDEVTHARFSRVILGMKLSLHPDEIEAIASLFPGADATKVRYKDFMESVRSTSAIEVSAADVVRRLKAFLATSFVTLAQSASRFDREHSGIISAPQFSSALQFLKFAFSSQDLAAIRAAYPGPSRGTINWKVLCAEVDPSAEPAPSPAPLPDPANRPRPPTAIAELVAKIASGAHFVGLDLAGEFRRADGRENGGIPQETFAQILKQLPIELSVSETRALVSFYRVSGSNSVNYVNFLLDAAAKPEPVAAPTPPQSPTPPSLPAGVHDVLKRYKAFCVQRRIAPTDVFTPYDVPSTGPLTLSASNTRISGGFLPINRLQAAFNNLQFELRRGEVEALQAAFADGRRPDLFNYGAFLRALKAEDIASPEIRASLASMPLSHDVEETARLAAGQIREKLLARHRKIAQAFSGVSDETIAPEEFQRRLFAMDLVVRSNQMQALLRKYRVNLTGQVDWRAFVANVDQSKTIGD